MAGVDAPIDEQSGGSQAGAISAREASSLTDPFARLTAELLGAWIERGARTAAQFVEYFTPIGLLGALSPSPTLRVKVLVECCGTHEAIAARKSLTSATEDFELALDEGTTSPDFVFQLLSTDEWTAALGAQEVWRFLTSDEFWRTSNGDPAFTQARERMQQAVQLAEQLGLVALHELANSSPTEMLERLTPAQLRSAMLEAIEAGRRGQPFTIDDLVAITPVDDWLSELPMNQAWTVFAARLKAAKSDANEGAPEVSGASSPGESNAGNASTGDAPRPRLRSGYQRSPSSSRPPAKPTTIPEESEHHLESPVRAPRRSRHATMRSSSELSRSAPDIGVAAAPPSMRKLSGEAAEVCQRLDQLDRLPPNFLQLPVEALLAIERMYRLLAETIEPPEQLNVIRAAFPDDQIRAKSMLSLLERLNPKLLITTPSLAGEDADSLSVRLLREERRRTAADVSASKKPSAAT